MKSLEIKRLALRIVTSCVLSVVIVSGSMVTLAASGKPVGEILVSGVSVKDGEAVLVNGEPAKSGRTIFTASSISTPDGMSAIVNLGKAGRIQLAPASNFVLDVSGDNITGSLTSGSVTVLSSVQGVGVKTLTGDLISLTAGETANATSGSASAKAQTGPGGLNWYVWAAIIGGATAAVILAVTLSDDDNNNVSPVR